MTKIDRIVENLRRDQIKLVLSGSLPSYLHDVFSEKKTSGSNVVVFNIKEFNNWLTKHSLKLVKNGNRMFVTDGFKKIASYSMEY